MRHAATILILIVTTSTARPAWANYLYVTTNNTVIAYDTLAASPTPATVISSGLDSPEGLAFDTSKNLYVANLAGVIEKYTPGVGASQFASGFGLLYGLAFDPFNGGIYVADEFPERSIYAFTPGGTARLVASGLANPDALAFDPSGNLFVANFAGDSILKIAPSGAASVFASNGLNGPDGLAFDPLGNLYVSNIYNHDILKLTPSGVSSQFVGGLDSPQGLAFDSIGNLFVANGTAIDMISPDGSARVFANTAAATRYLTFGPEPNSFAVPEPSSQLLIALGLVPIFAHLSLTPFARRSRPTT